VDLADVGPARAGDLLLCQLSDALGSEDLDGGRELGGLRGEQLPDVERPSDLEGVLEAIREQPVLGLAIGAAELVGGEDRPAKGMLRQRRPRRPTAGAGDLPAADDRLVAVRKSSTGEAASGAAVTGGGAQPSAPARPVAGIRSPAAGASGGCSSCDRSPGDLAEQARLPDAAAQREQLEPAVQAPRPLTTPAQLRLQRRQRHRLCELVERADHYLVDQVDRLGVAGRAVRGALRPCLFAADRAQPHRRVLLAVAAALVVAVTGPGRCERARGRSRR
jgi:hypothetical protein